MIQTVTLDKLTLSPINVRQTDIDAHIASLADDIAARGLKQNLVAIRIDDDHYEVIAGGRRLQALQVLATRGDIAPDFDVPVLIEDAGQGVETSLAENIQRVAMNPADEYTAFTIIFDQLNGERGERIEHICKRFGKTRLFVEQRLRLGQLHPTILEALRTDKITLAQAMAFGTTGDTERQVFLWNELGFDCDNNDWRRQPKEVRKALTSGSFKSSDRLALFVGREAYIAAGGEIEKDLFTDDTAEIWRDGTIIEKLASVSLTAIAATMQTEEGWQDVRPWLSSHVGYEEYSQFHSYRPRGVPAFNKKQQKQFDEWHEEVSAIEEELANAPQYEEEYVGNRSVPVDAELRAKVDKIVEIEAKIAALENEATKLPVGSADYPRFIRYLLISDDGTIKYNDEWYSTVPVDNKGQPVAAKEKPVDDKPKSALSQSVIDELSLQRRDILAAELVTRPLLAFTYAAFCLADSALGKLAHLYNVPRGSGIASSETGTAWGADRNESHMQQTKARDALSDFELTLDLSWFGSRDNEGRFVWDEKDVVVRFKAFGELPNEQQMRWLTWATAQSFERSCAAGYVKPIHDELADAMDIDVSAWWQPSAANYWSRLSGSDVEQQLREAGALPADAKLKLKKAELVAEAHKCFSGEKPTNNCFTGSNDVRKWTPPAMRFNSPAGQTS
jgi:ParB family transcriptional regulator, chromosome partitioning protein